MSTRCKFEGLISPFSADNFFQDYYEKKDLYISRGDDKYYDCILNADDVDVFFQNKAIHASSLRVVKEGEELPAYRWTLGQSSIVDNDKLFAVFNQGYTLISAR